MSQYFSEESFDMDEGRIRSRPKRIEDERDRLLGTDPTRQVATMHIRRDGNQVVAHVSVAVQTQRSQMRRDMNQVGEMYDSVPNKTPAELEAATTVQQNENWEVTRYAHDLENRILNDLYKALNPPARTP
jgi:hypothetical protein